MNKAKEALNTIKEIETSHTEQEWDEDSNGDLVFDTITVNDGHIEYQFPEEFKILEDELDSSEKMRDVILELIDIDPYNMNCIGQCLDVVKAILKANISEDINHKCEKALECLCKL